MISATATTFEVTNMEEAASQLANEIKSKIELCNNKCGILYYDYEIDGISLVQYLKDLFEMDIIGCSTIATIENMNGYCDLAAVFMVLTSDDCYFQTAISEKLNLQKSKEETEKMFLEAKSKLDQEPKLMFFIPPTNSEVIVDNILEDLSKVSSDIPIIGGVPSSETGLTSCSVYNGDDASESIIVLLIAGNVKPVFSVANVTNVFNEKTCKITKSEGAKIYEVNDNKTLLEFIESFGINIADIQNSDGRSFFHKYPLLLSDPKLKAMGDLPFIRMISSIDPESGVTDTYANIPEGVEVNLAVLNREDIKVSTDKSVGDLLQKINQEQSNGYQYSTIFCITCAARHFIMNPNYAQEGTSIKNMVPDYLNVAGFYGYGEISPTSVVHGKAVNRVHNGSINFCAI